MERRIVKMKYNPNNQSWKTLLLLGATLIAISSLYFTNQLVETLSKEEQKKMSLWAEATQKLSSGDLSDQDYSLVLKVIQGNTTIPVLLIDSANQMVSHRNIDEATLNAPDFFNRFTQNPKVFQNRIKVELGENNYNYVYYNESTLLTQLRYFPYIQLTIILIFILLAYYFFNSSRKAEQNKVWVGLTKETAHQLGTPTSSLLGWLEVIRDKIPDDPLLSEMEKDIKRLEKITERFSKAGSKPKLNPTQLTPLISSAIDYMKYRTSDKVTYLFNPPTNEIISNVSKSLLEWVIENLIKNAIDAMEGKGTIIVSLSKQSHWVVLDIADTGKGILKKNFKTIFKPGFTTKERGWGLGLSLSKRIIEEYHEGKIFVESSIPGKGSKFRILLKTC